MNKPKGDIFRPHLDAPTYTIVNLPLCPDLLRIEQIGGADGWRGKVVRGFFRVLKVVTGV